MNYIYPYGIIIFCCVIITMMIYEDRAIVKQSVFDFLNKMRELYFPKVQRFYYSAKHNEWLAKLNEDGGFFDFGGHYEYDFSTGRHEYVYDDPVYEKNKRVFMNGIEYTEWISTDGIEPLTAHFGDLVLVLERYHEDDKYEGFRQGPACEHGVFFNEDFNDHRMPKLEDRMDPWFYQTTGLLLKHIHTFFGTFNEKKLSVA